MPLPMLPRRRECQCYFYRQTEENHCTASRLWVHHIAWYVKFKIVSLILGLTFKSCDDESTWLHWFRGRVSSRLHDRVNVCISIWFKSFKPGFFSVENYRALQNLKSHSFWSNRLLPNGTRATYFIVDNTRITSLGLALFTLFVTRYKCQQTISQRLDRVALGTWTLVFLIAWRSVWRVFVVWLN